MPNVFSLAWSHCADLTDPSLRAEIEANTGSEVAVDSILRSLGRFGDDPSIERFELTPRKPGRGERTTNPVSWSIRAVRASDAGPDSDDSGQTPD